MANDRAFCGGKSEIWLLIARHIVCHLPYKPGITDLILGLHCLSDQASKHVPVF